MAILGMNGQVINGPQVPLVGRPDQPVIWPIPVQITEELKQKLVYYCKKRGIDGQSLVAEILCRGLGSLGAELPYPENEEPAKEEPQTQEQPSSLVS